MVPAKATSIEKFIPMGFHLPTIAWYMLIWDRRTPNLGSQTLCGASFYHPSLCVRGHWVLDIHPEDMCYTHGDRLFSQYFSMSDFKGCDM